NIIRISFHSLDVYNIYFDKNNNIKLTNKNKKIYLKKSKIIDSGKIVCQHLNVYIDDKEEDEYDDEDDEYVPNIDHSRRFILICDHYDNKGYLKNVTNYKTK